MPQLNEVGGIIKTIIGTDYIRTLTVIEYKRLDFAATATGFHNIKCNSTKYFINSLNSMNLLNSSNIGIPGKHVYLLVNLRGRYLINLCTD